MKVVNIRENMFYGASETELEKLDLGNSFLLFVRDPRKAYSDARTIASATNSREVVIHINWGSFMANIRENGDQEIRLGKAGKEAYQLGLARVEGGGEVRIYRGEGMGGIEYFRTIFLE